MDDVRVEPLGANHDRSAFDCGQAALNHHLQRHASQDVRRRMALVFVAVVSTTPSTVLGYYSLSATNFDRADLPEEAAKRLPRYPVPAAILGRLAVAIGEQGQGRGEFLLLDALRRVLSASALMAVHAVVVDAKDERAAAFYARYGFQVFPSTPLRLFLPLDTIAASGLLADR